MSTRAMIEVISSEGKYPSGETKIELYHHSDGYPSYMVPMLKRAFRKYAKPAPGAETYAPYGTKSSAWKAGRAGYAAGYICAEDPGMVQPEECGQGEHGDLDYVYKVWVSAENGRGSLDAKPKWEVEILGAGGGIVQSRRPVLQLKPSDTYRDPEAGESRRE